MKKNNMSKIKYFFENLIAWIILISIIVIFIGIIVGIVYVFRVMPYNNDWNCLIAQCRVVK